MLLAGTFELTIDAKNRMSVPFAVRRKLSESGETQSFYLTPGRRRGTLALYPERHYEQLRAKVPADDSLSDDTYDYVTFEFSQSALLETDDQGRVLVPARLLERAGIKRECVLIGVRDHLELWSKENFEAFEREMWESYPQKRSASLQEINALAAGPSGSSPQANPS